jgi:erythromycin esterase
MNDCSIDGSLKDGRGAFFSHFRLSAVIFRVVIALTVGIGLTTSIRAQVAEEDQVCGERPERLPRLNLLNLQSEILSTGDTKCYVVSLQRGEFLRLSLEIEAGFIRIRVLEPRDNNPILVTWGWGPEYMGSPTLPISFEASTSGLHIVELVVPVMSWSETVPLKLQIDERLSAKTRAASREDLRNDPRKRFLREYAMPIRSIDPADEDLSDLEFLRKQLDGVRILLLGEGAPGHGGGSELKAKTRIVKFLHREMGFDVLALESGLFGTSSAWHALRTDEDPQEAFLKGSYRVWGWSEQVQALIHYLAASARTDHPLELTGFDSQFSGTARRKSLLLDLREFLTQNEIESPLSDPDSTQTRILAGILEGRFPPDQEHLLQPAEQARLVKSLQVTAAQIERTVSGRDGLFWAQVLRSASVQAGLFLDNLRNRNSLAERWASAGARDRQMAENLLWLVDTYYRGHKIIVWTHIAHAMRNPHYTTLGREQGFTMGHGVWEALGDESYVIGFTSYTGASGCITCTEGWEGLRQDIIADQNPSFEFEELMEAAGHEFAWVNLRAARAEGQWLGGAFLARPVFDSSDHAPWSEILDALLFIRTGEPSRRFTGVK